MAGAPPRADAPPRGAGAGWRVPGPPSAPPSVRRRAGRRRQRGRHPRGAFGWFPSAQGQVPSVRASAASRRRATRVVPCASVLVPGAAPRRPGSGMATCPGLRAPRGLGRGAGRRFKDSGGPRRPGRAAGLAVGWGGAWWGGRRSWVPLPPPPALAPGGRRARPPRAAGPERGSSPLLSPRSGLGRETPRARALGRCRPCLRSEGAETRVSAPRPRRVRGAPRRIRRRPAGPARAAAAVAAAAPLVPCRRAPAASRPSAPRRSRRSPLATSVAAPRPARPSALPAAPSEQAGGPV